MKKLTIAELIELKDIYHKMVNGMELSQLEGEKVSAILPYTYYAQIQKCIYSNVVTYFMENPNEYSWVKKDYPNIYNDCKTQLLEKDKSPDLQPASEPASVSHTLVFAEGKDVPLNTIPGSNPKANQVHQMFDKMLNITDRMEEELHYNRYKYCLDLCSKHQPKYDMRELVAEADKLYKKMLGHK